VLRRCHADGDFIHAPLDDTLYKVNKRACALLFKFGDNSVIETTGSQGEALGGALANGLLGLAGCNEATGEFGSDAMRTMWSTLGSTTVEDSCAPCDEVCDPPTAPPTLPPTLPVVAGTSTPTVAETAAETAAETTETAPASNVVVVSGGNRNAMRDSLLTLACLVVAPFLANLA